MVIWDDLGDDGQVDLEDFNALPDQELRAVLSTCLAVGRWVDEVAAKRPYPDQAVVLAQADASARTLTEQEVAAALALHPRIGERPKTDDEESRFSRREQSGVDEADIALARRLAEGNAAYEARFGRVFLIRAKGRDSGEILAELDRRLGNDRRAEVEEVAGQLREIAVLRLEEVLEQWAQ
jgi:2-oxo-4-hydroxy-4-carboxy-5-ureidoimidazoline decarboxylase